MRQIGTVQTLIDRVYQINPSLDRWEGNSAFVTPGVWPLLCTEQGERFWVMDGRTSEWHCDVDPVGGGMFVVHQGDVVSDQKVVVGSMRYTELEWERFLTGPLCQPGPEQRLVVTLFESAVPA